jgi:predicted aspartyl protease
MLNGNLTKILLRFVLLLVCGSVLLLQTGCEMANRVRLRYANDAIVPVWPQHRTLQQFQAFYIGEKPYIRIQLQTAEQQAELLMLIDTGASVSLLFDSQKVQQLNLPKGYSLPLGGWGDGQDSQAWQTEVAALKLGEVQLHDVSLAYLPVAQSPYFLRSDELVYDGVLGHDILRHFSWTFMPHQQLITASLLPYQPKPEDIAVELSLSFSKISVPVTLHFNRQQQLTKEVMVDTGSRHYLKLNSALLADEHIRLPAQQITAADFGLSGRVVHQRVTVPQLQLGSLAMGPLPANVIPSDDEDDWNIIGSALLNQYVSTIDYHSMRLYLRPVPGAPFRALYNLAGIEMRKLQDGHFVIRYLFPDLPAAQSKLKEGDIIQRINGKSAVDYSEDDWLLLNNQPQQLELCTAQLCADFNTRQIAGYSVPASTSSP